MFSEVNECAELLYNVVCIEDCGSDDSGHVIRTYSINGCIINTTVGNLNRMLKSLDIAYEMANLYEDNIIDMIVEDNILKIKVKAKDGRVFVCRLASYTKIIKSRQNFIEVVNSRGHKLVSSYIGSEYNLQIDFNCGHEPQWVNACQYLSGNSKCHVCSHREIQPYMNDVYTLRKDILPYVVDENELIGEKITSDKVVRFKCPDCGAEYDLPIVYVTGIGFRCQKCSDGFKYPEKFVQALLNHLNVDYLYHNSPEWGKYKVLDDKKKHWYQYDFIIESMKIIIETDGGQHKEEEQKKIDNKKDELAMENGYDVIRIDCDYVKAEVRFEYIKNNTIHALQDIFDLSHIDWGVVANEASNSKIIQAADYWNAGKSTGEIATLIDVSLNSVRNYLIEMASVGYCDYDVDVSLLRTLKEKCSRRYICHYKVINQFNELVGVFIDFDNFLYNIYLKTGKYISRECLTRLINGKTSNIIINGKDKCHIEAISEDEYNLLIKSDIITDEIDTQLPIVMGRKNDKQLYENIKNKFGIAIF